MLSVLVWSVCISAFVVGFGGAVKTPDQDVWLPMTGVRVGFYWDCPLGQSIDSGTIDVFTNGTVVDSEQNAFEFISGACRQLGSACGSFGVSSTDGCPQPNVSSVRIHYALCRHHTVDHTALITDSIPDHCHASVAVPWVAGRCSWFSAVASSHVIEPPSACLWSPHNSNGGTSQSWELGWHNTTCTAGNANSSFYNATAQESLWHPSQAAFASDPLARPGICTCNEPTDMGAGGADTPLFCNGLFPSAVPLPSRDDYNAEYSPPAYSMPMIPLDTQLDNQWWLLSASRITVNSMRTTASGNPLSREYVFASPSSELTPAHTAGVFAVVRVESFEEIIQWLMEQCALISDRGCDGISMEGLGVDYDDATRDCDPTTAHVRIRVHYFQEAIPWPSSVYSSNEFQVWGNNNDDELAYAACNFRSTGWVFEASAVYYLATGRVPAVVGYPTVPQFRCFAINTDNSPRVELGAWRHAYNGPSITCASNDLYSLGNPPHILVCDQPSGYTGPSFCDGAVPSAVLANLTEGMQAGYEPWVSDAAVAFAKAQETIRLPPIGAMPRWGDVQASTARFGVAGLACGNGASEEIHTASLARDESGTPAIGENPLTAATRDEHLLDIATQLCAEAPHCVRVIWEPSTDQPCNATHSTVVFRVCGLASDPQPLSSWSPNDEPAARAVICHSEDDSPDSLSAGAADMCRGCRCEPDHDATAMPHTQVATCVLDDSTLLEHPLAIMPETWSMLWRDYSKTITSIEWGRAVPVWPESKFSADSGNEITRTLRFTTDRESVNDHTLWMDSANDVVHVGLDLCLDIFGSDCSYVSWEPVAQCESSNEALRSYVYVRFTLESANPSAATVASTPDPHMTLAHCIEEDAGVGPIRALRSGTLVLSDACPYFCERNEPYRFRLTPGIDMFTTCGNGCQWCNIGSDSRHRLISRVPDDIPENQLCETLVQDTWSLLSRWWPFGGPYHDQYPSEVNVSPGAQLQCVGANRTNTVQFVGSVSNAMRSHDFARTLGRECGDDVACTGFGWTVTSVYSPLDDSARVPTATYNGFTCNDSYAVINTDGPQVANTDGSWSVLHRMGFNDVSSGGMQVCPLTYGGVSYYAEIPIAFEASEIFEGSNVGVSFEFLGLPPTIDSHIRWTTRLGHDVDGNPTCVSSPRTDPSGYHACSSMYVDPDSTAGRDAGYPIDLPAEYQMYADATDTLGCQPRSNECAPYGSMTGEQAGSRYGVNYGGVDHTFQCTDCRTPFTDVSTYHDPDGYRDEQCSTCDTGVCGNWLCHTDAYTLRNVEFCNCSAHPIWNPDGLTRDANLGTGVGPQAPENGVDTRDCLFCPNPLEFTGWTDTKFFTEISRIGRGSTWCRPIYLRDALRPEFAVMWPEIEPWALQGESVDSVIRASIVAKAGSGADLWSCDDGVNATATHLENRCVYPLDQSNPTSRCFDLRNRDDICEDIAVCGNANRVNRTLTIQGNHCVCNSEYTGALCLQCAGDTPYATGNPPPLATCVTAEQICEEQGVSDPTRDPQVGGFGRALLDAHEVEIGDHVQCVYHWGGSRTPAICTDGYVLTSYVARRSREDVIAEVSIADIYLVSSFKMCVEPLPGAIDSDLQPITTYYDITERAQLCAHGIPGALFNLGREVCICDIGWANENPNDARTPCSICESGFKGPTCEACPLCPEGAACTWSPELEITGCDCLAARHQERPADSEHILWDTGCGSCLPNHIDMGHGCIQCYWGCNNGACSTSDPFDPSPSCVCDDGWTLDNDFNGRSCTQCDTGFVGQSCDACPSACPDGVTGCSFNATLGGPSCDCVAERKSFESVTHPNNHTTFECGDCTLGFHGPECVPCHGDCGNGDCLWSRTENTTVCVCDASYDGAACDACVDGFIPDPRESEHLSCLACPDCPSGAACVFSGVHQAPLCQCADANYTHTPNPADGCDACAVGFTGDGDCAYACPSCNSNGGECAMSEGSAVCECWPGYMGVECNACAAGHVMDGRDGSCHVCPSCPSGAPCVFSTSLGGARCDCASANRQENGNECGDCLSGFAGLEVSTSGTCGQPCPDCGVGVDTCTTDLLGGETDSATCVCLDGYVHTVFGDPTSACNTCETSFVVREPYETCHYCKSSCAGGAACVWDESEMQARCDCASIHFHDNVRTVAGLGLWTDCSSDNGCITNTRVGPNCVVCPVGGCGTGTCVWDNATTRAICECTSGSRHTTRGNALTACVACADGEAPVTCQVCPVCADANECVGTGSEVGPAVCECMGRTIDTQLLEMFPSLIETYGNRCFPNATADGIESQLQSGGASTINPTVAPPTGDGMPDWVVPVGLGAVGFVAVVSGAVWFCKRRITAKTVAYTPVGPAV